MEKTMIINFRNEVQVALYECELKGQISDGHWENSRPYDHWIRMCKAKAKVGEPLGPNFYPMRTYNFAAKPLVDVVGQRMLFIAKLKMLFPHLSYQTIRELDDLVDCETGESRVKELVELAKERDYWEKKLAIIKQSLNVGTEQELEDVVKRIIDFKGYDLRKLRKDLRDMSQIVNKKLREG